MKTYAWKCRICGGTETLSVSIHPEQAVSWRTDDGRLRSWATASAGVSGIEHTCPEGTLSKPSEKGSL